MQKSYLRRNLLICRQNNLHHQLYGYCYGNCEKYNFDHIILQWTLQNVLKDLWQINEVSATYKDPRLIKFSLQNEILENEGTYLCLIHFLEQLALYTGKIIGIPLPSIVKQYTALYIFLQILQE